MTPQLPKPLAALRRSAAWHIALWHTCRAALPLRQAIAAWWQCALAK